MVKLQAGQLTQLHATTDRQHFICACRQGLRGSERAPLRAGLLPQVIPPARCVLMSTLPTCTSSACMTCRPTAPSPAALTLVRPGHPGHIAPSSAALTLVRPGHPTCTSSVYMTPSLVSDSTAVSSYVHFASRLLRQRRPCMMTRGCCPSGSILQGLGLRRGIWFGFGSAVVCAQQPRAAVRLARSCVREAGWQARWGKWVPGSGVLGNRPVQGLAA